MRRVSIALLYLWASAAAAADGELQCGRLTSRITEKKLGDFYTHQTQIYLGTEKKTPVVALAFVGPPKVGCLRTSALMVAGGSPVEGRSVVLFFPDGRYEGLHWDTPVEFHSGQAILRGPIWIWWYRDEDQEKIPPGLRDLFQFPDAPK